MWVDVPESDERRDVEDLRAGRALDFFRVEEACASEPVGVDRESFDLAEPRLEGRDFLAAPVAFDDLLRPEEEDDCAPELPRAFLPPPFFLSPVDAFSVFDFVDEPPELFLLPDLLRDLVDSLEVEVLTCSTSSPF